MSFDPTLPQDPPPELPPTGTAGPDPAGARQRTVAPGVLLIVAGVLNLLFAGFMGLAAVSYSAVTPEMLDAQAQKDPRFQKQMEELQKVGWTVDDLLTFSVRLFTTLLGLNLLTSLLSIVSGVRMMQAKNYGLVLFTSLVTMVPFLSGSGCCCVGEIAGIWALVVLLQPDVRDAFR